MRRFSWLPIVLLVNGCMLGLLGAQGVIGARLAAGRPASQSCGSGGGEPGQVCGGWVGSQAPLVSTNCHWHHDATVYWAHCAPTEGHYLFRMHLTCQRGNQSYPIEGDWARSPDRIYSQPTSCGSGAGDPQTAS